MLQHLTKFLDVREQNWLIGVLKFTRSAALTVHGLIQTDCWCCQMGFPPKNGTELMFSQQLSDLKKDDSHGTVGD